MSNNDTVESLDGVLGWCGNAVATMLEWIAWPWRLANVIDPGLADGGASASRFFLALGMIAFVWLVIGLMLFLLLDRASWSLRWWTPTLTRSMDLARTEATVKAAFGISMALWTAASWFGSARYRPRETSDALARWNTRSWWRTFTAHCVRFLLRLPYVLGAVVQFGWHLATRPFLWICAVAAWFVVFQPTSSVWAVFSTILREFLGSFSPSSAAAWITVLTFVVAIMFTSVRWRAINSWRVSRYVHAHELLNDMAIAANNALLSLYKVLDTRARSTFDVTRGCMRAYERQLRMGHFFSPVVRGQLSGLLESPAHSCPR